MIGAGLLGRMRACAPGVIAFCLIFGFTDLAAVAATPSASELQAIQREQEQLLRMEEERRREQERLRKLKELQPPEPEEKPEPKPEQESERCFQIERITVDGVSVLSDSKIAALTSVYIGRCMKVADIEALLQQLNDAFRDAGYVTTRAYVPQQDLNEGTLLVNVLEGRIESLTLGDNGLREQLQLLFAFPTGEEDILNLRDVEQGLDQMNRLTSNNAKMQIQPGKEAGTSVVAVSNETGRRMRVELGRDNAGTQSTGKLRNVGAVYMDDILGVNDGWSLSFSKNARGHNLERMSRSVSGVVSVPFGYSTLTYSGSYYEYASVVEGSSQDFLTSGLSTSNKLELSHVLHRDQDSKTRLDMGLTRKKSRNFLEDVQLETSSRNLTIGHLALAHSTRLFDGVFSAEIQHQRGLKALHAKEDSNSQDTADPKAQFRKWLLDVSYARSFKVAEENITWNSTTSWQYAQDTLFGTERIGVGGQYSVRGFREDTLSGDTGGYWRNEIAWKSAPDDWSGPLMPVIGRLEPYAAFDWGWIKKDLSEDEEKGVMSGVTLGLRNSADYFDFDIFYAQGLAAPGFIEKESHELYFSAKLTF